MWDGDGTNDLNVGRFMMDRHMGAFENTAIGHGTVYDNLNETCVADPLSGALTFQHANPRPFPANGALDANGVHIGELEHYGHASQYSTVLTALRNPLKFYIGLTGWSHWLSPTTKVGGKERIWGDVSTSVEITDTESVTMTEDDKVERVTKSIFDPSPLGWMVPNKFTYNDLGYNLVQDGTSNIYSTSETYRTFARFFYASYRGSANGLMVRVKQLSSATYDGYMRTNESHNLSHNNTYRDDSSFAFQSTSTSDIVTSTGKASGCSIRCITQATYKTSKPVEPEEPEEPVVP